MKFSPFILSLLVQGASAFSIVPVPSFTTTSTTLTRTGTGASLHALAPSKITDDDGPTPEVTSDPPIYLNEEDVPEMHYDEDAIPIPHQPWRRGDTDGCEDPIDAPWRLEGEEIIRLAVESVAASVKDVTWYMAACVVTLEDSHGWNVDGPTGPEVRVEETTQPQWFDEDDMEPEDDYGIYAGEEDGRIETVDEEGNLSSGIPNDPYLER